MNPADFIRWLEEHDWYFDRSDDSRTYSRGAASQRRLLAICQQTPELFRLYNHASACVIRGEPFNFQSITGSSVKDEKPNNTTNTDTMKELNALLDLLFERLSKPIIDAIRESCGKGTCTGPVTGEAKPITETAASQTKAEAKAAAKAKPTADAAALPPISSQRLLLTVQTLGDVEKKKKLKAMFVKTFGVDSMAELNDEARPRVHAAAIKMGAVDTTPPEEQTAEAPAAEDEFSM